MKNKALLVCIEGSDGVGKTTQVAAVAEHLRKTGLKVGVLKYPQYETQTGKWVTEYLGGGFGLTSSVDPLLPSLLYSINRLEGKNHLKSLLEQNDIVIQDRSLFSNVALQSARYFKHQNNSLRYLVGEMTGRMYHIEVDVMSIPQPDIIYVLTADAKTLNKSLEERDEKRDIHENAYISELANSAYGYICELVPVANEYPINRGDYRLSVEELTAQLANDVSDLYNLTRKHTKGLDGNGIRTIDCLASVIVYNSIPDDNVEDCYPKTMEIYNPAPIDESGWYNTYNIVTGEELDRTRID